MSYYCLFPSAPSVPPVFHLQNLQSGNAILVVLKPIPKEHQHGIINGYIVYYKERYHYEETKLNISSSLTQVILFGLHPFKEYEIAVEAFTSKVGPRSEWQTIVVGKWQYCLLMNQWMKKSKVIKLFDYL